MISELPDPAARYIYNDYHSRALGCVDKMGEISTGNRSEPEK